MLCAARRFAASTRVLSPRQLPTGHDHAVPNPRISEGSIVAFSHFGCRPQAQQPGVARTRETNDDAGLTRASISEQPWMPQRPLPNANAQKQYAEAWTPPSTRRADTPPRVFPRSSPVLPDR